MQWNIISFRNDTDQWNNSTVPLHISIPLWSNINISKINPLKIILHQFGSDHCFLHTRIPLLPYLEKIFQAFTADVSAIIKRNFCTSFKSSPASHLSNTKRSLYISEIYGVTAFFCHWNGRWAVEPRFAIRLQSLSFFTLAVPEVHNLRRT